MKNIPHKINIKYNKIDKIYPKGYKNIISPVGYKKENK